MFRVFRGVKNGARDWPVGANFCVSVEFNSRKVVGNFGRLFCLADEAKALKEKREMEKLSFECGFE